MTHLPTFVKRDIDAFMRWVDCHPRLGWYIAFMVTLNTLLIALDLVK